LFAGGEHSFRFRRWTPMGLVKISEIRARVANR
jgi:hypothetical protein